MVKENRKDEENSGGVQLLEKPESKPAVNKKNEAKPTVVKTKQNKPAVKQHKETKPAVKQKEENKPVVKSNKQNKPTVVKSESSKPAVVETKESKPAVVETKDSKPTVVEEKQDSVTVQAKPSEAKNVFLLYGVLVGIFLALIIIAFLVFSVFMTNQTTIHSGISIKGIDVSSLSKNDANKKVNSFIKQNVPEEIVLVHDDFETAIPTKELNITFDINNAIESAYKIGRTGNFISDGFESFGTLLFNKDFEPSFTINEEYLEKALNDISTKLPDKLIESGYYLDGNDLVLNKGKNGYVVNTKLMTKSIKNEISKLNLNNKIEIITSEASPSILNIDEIYNKVHLEPTNASYTAEPRTFTPSKNGVDFDISIDEAKQKLAESEQECVIPLKVVYPSITTNMIGEEAFPDILSEFSTYYYAGNYNRTTNLKLASAKINGTVLMPGEEFSYNDVVGERTIAAGYKEAPIYISGRVEDGLGGGICQITTTLYNAVVYANLEITDRSNHQFVPSYIGAGLDATVYYGSVDFKFKNNRNYPIKIISSVEGGVAYFKILGLRTPEDYDVEIYARVTGQSAKYTNSETYKILYKDGVVVDQVLLSKDTYMRH